MLVDFLLLKVIKSVDNSFFKRLLDKNEPIIEAVLKPFLVAWIFTNKEVIAKIRKIIERNKKGSKLVFSFKKDGRYFSKSISFEREIRASGYIPITIRASNKPEVKMRSRVFKYLDLISFGKIIQRFFRESKISKFLLNKFI